MKFDYVIGNPPYQEEDGGAQASARPVYQYFFEQGTKISKNVEIIMPTRWYAGGKGLDEFRVRMLSDKHIKVLHDYLYTEQIFPKVNIRGGVCIVLWSEDYDNIKHKTEIYTHFENKTEINKRNLKQNDIEIFIRYNDAISIINKIQDADNISGYISSLRPFGLRGYFTKDEKFRETDDGLISPVRCIGKGRSIGFMERNEVPIHKEWIDMWKVYIPRANNIGTELNDDNLNSFVGEPGTLCTESFLLVGVNLITQKYEAENLANYMQTRFVRFLHSISKSSQDATSKTWRFVPVQDFTKNSDINWENSIYEIDKQLYKKYNFSEEEINFIETNIKSM